MKFISVFLNDIKLRYKLIIIYIVIALIPLLTVGGYFYWQMSDMLIEQQITNGKNYLYQTTNYVTSKLAVYNNLSNYLAFDKNISTVLSSNYDSTYDYYQAITNDIDSVIDSLTYFNENITKLTIYYDNIDVEHGTTLAPLSSISSESWYDDVWISSSPSWMIDRESKTAFSIRVMPSLIQEGVDAVLYLEVNYDSLFSSLEDDQMNDFGVIALLGDEIVFQKESFTTTNFKNYSLKDITDLAEPKYAISVDSDEESTLKFIVYQPNILSSESIRNLYIYAGIVVLITLLMTIIALRLLSRFITDRIENLTRNIKKVEDGDFAVSISSHGNDEIGMLVRGFKKMVAEIKRLITEVYRGQLDQKSYELRALQQQINPHFLYNTLSMINFKALEVGEKDISKITLALSSFYRTSLNKGNNYCTIQEELNNVKSYLDIQLMMHDYDFEVDILVNEDIYQNEILNLVLQPIVENSIVHGLDDVLDDRKGFIKITSEYDSETITIVVEDNGIGMSEEKCQSILAKDSKGYGVRNVDQRIKLFYGEQYGLKITSVKDIGSKVTLTIPRKRVGII